MRSITRRLAASATQAEVEAQLSQLVADPEVDGVLLQLPLPKHLDEARALALIDPAKDVDGLTELSAGDWCWASRGCGRARPMAAW